MTSTVDAQGNLTDWDEAAVHTWLSSIGFSQYESQIHEHGITGEVLGDLDHEYLKEVGVHSVGQRLAILKAIYHLKVAHNVPIEPDHYVPPSETVEATVPEGPSLSKVADQVSKMEERIVSLEQENQRLHEGLQMCLEELVGPSRATQQSQKEPRSTTATSEGAALRKQPSFKWAQYVRPGRSPTRATGDVPQHSPKGSPQSLEHEILTTGPKAGRDGTGNTDRQQVPTRSGTPQASVVPIGTPPQSQLKTPASSSTQNGSSPRGVADATDIRSFKVSMDDPAWKVLPAALKKYKINNDDWQNYAMFICYGSTERCLSYDEKPLLLFQKLKDAKKNPVFMLKHIKDIRSPIAVAQQKQAQKAQSSSSRPNTTPSSRHQPGSKSQPHANATPPLLTANNGPPQWPEVMSPTVHTEPQHSHSRSDPQEQPRSRTITAGTSNTAAADDDTLTNPDGVSYAIAIYPYMAEQDDEFDVAVNDTFIILSRARGWWVVQRDPTGSGVVNQDSPRGWVPAGCLLETSIPVASAIEQATAATPTVGSFMPTKTPILPLSIISTSFPGVALMEYKKKGDEELDLNKDDALRVFKRYNHWSYAVKEEGGDRGWVPSWFIGKLGSNGAPMTPGASMHTSSTTTLAEADVRYEGATNGSGGSPVSPGFSTTSTRVATTVI